MIIAGKTILDPEQLQYKENNNIRFLELLLRQEDIKDVYDRKWDILKSYNLEIVQVHAPHVELSSENLRNSLKVADHFGVPLIVHYEEFKDIEDKITDTNNLLIENSELTSLDSTLSLVSKYNICLDLEHLYKILGRKPLINVLEELVIEARNQISQNLYEEYYDYPINFISRVLHVCNCYDEFIHLPLFAGEINYNKVFQVLKNYNFGKMGDEIIVVETPIKDVESIRYVEKEFREQLYSI